WDSDLFVGVVSRDFSRSIQFIHVGSDLLFRGFRSIDFVMEDNICDINHLDTDVLLPPRKRLLAGLKKQVSDDSFRMCLLSSARSDFDSRLNSLLSSYLSNPNLSPDEIVEASKKAAAVAVKAAKAAKAAAEEKAAVAANAITAAKNALEVLEKAEAASGDRYLKKNKMKKHIPVHALYKKHRPVENNKTDEELARTLHRAMNSSPRISKNCSGSDSKRHKKPKSSSAFVKTKFLARAEVLEGNPYSTCNGSALHSKVDSETFMMGENGEASNCNKSDQSETESEELGMDYSKEKNGDIVDCMVINGRKRGRIKQKKLPLSICTIKDRANPNEEHKFRNSMLSDKTMGKQSRSKIHISSAEPSSNGVVAIEPTSIRKFQEIRGPSCIKQNKIMQSLREKLRYKMDKRRTSKSLKRHKSKNSAHCMDQRMKKAIDEIESDSDINRHVQARAALYTAKEFDDDFTGPIRKRVLILTSNAVT
ncbi:hypothetical protein RJ641_010781, partial [Dillenia turbinata]